MIAGPKLAAWLADRDAQARTRALVDEAQDWCSHYPLMRKLHRRLTELERPTAEDVAGAARAFMNELAETRHLIAQLIADASKDPFFRPPLGYLSTNLNTSLVLFHHPLLTIALGVTRAEDIASKKLAGQPGSVSFTGMLMIYRFIHAGHARLSMWEAAPAGHDFRANAAEPCRSIGLCQLSDGDEMVIDGRRRSFTVDHASGDMLFFQASVRAEAAPLGLEYDSETHSLLSSSATSEACSRVQMLVSALRCMDREDAIPVLAGLLEEPEFYLRWHVMREMLALDAEASLPWLRRMAISDVHSEVRDAAAQTLRIFFDDSPDALGEQLCHA